MLESQTNIVGKISWVFVDRICPNIQQHSGKDDRVKFWGQKVKGQGHSGVKYAAKSLSGLVSTIF